MVCDQKPHVDSIAILDFGGQYTHLIATRIRHCGVYSEILPSDTSVERLSRFKGVIFSGSPFSVFDNNRPPCNPEVLESDIPVLGLCYGHQLLVSLLGGKVERGDVREYGASVLKVQNSGGLFQGLDDNEPVWMSHGDTVESLPEGFVVLGVTRDCPFAAIAHPERKLFGLQFHPEVTHTRHGTAVLENFLSICECRRTWNTQTFLRQIEDYVRTSCGYRNVFLLVSGGVDSTVTFFLLNRILGPQRVQGLHIDTGLMRHNESAAIMQTMKTRGFENLHIVDASHQFLAALQGVVDPEEKRKRIGQTFLHVKEQAERELGLNADEWLLGQGTIYPDTIESAGTQHADTIKTHHNRVDVIQELLERGLCVEPLAQLYKDEVRELGEALGLPHELVWRHPFPGPGLGIRILCSDGISPDCAEEKVEPIRSIAVSHGYHARILPVRSVGVQGDARTYTFPALLSGPRDWDRLETTATEITNRVSHVNRVLYNITGETHNDYQVVKVCVDEEHLAVLRIFDDAVTGLLHKYTVYNSIWQMPVVLLPLVNNSNETCVVLRPVLSREAMTARFAVLDNEVIDAIIDAAKAIRGIGDIFYDITHKPPGTIEWE